MFQIQLIQQVVEWERRLEIENEQRVNYRSEPDYVPAAAQPVRKARRSIFARIFQRSQRQEVPCCYMPENCGETQPG